MDPTTRRRYILSSWPRRARWAATASARVRAPDVCNSESASAVSRAATSALKRKRVQVAGDRGQQHQHRRDSKPLHVRRLGHPPME